MANQLRLVLNALSDGQWHSLPEIGQKLNIRKRSVGSRIRDLRLPKYGNYKVETRKTTNPRVFEYRLLTQTSGGSQVLGPVFSSLPPITGGVTPLARGATSFVKFLNVRNLCVEQVPAKMCETKTYGPLKRLVAMDTAGQPMLHLLTLQESI
jgi:hypothetical protein